MARQKRPPLPEGDDGKTIANMDVDGMPWFLEKKNRAEPGQEPLSPEQLRQYRFAAVKAGLLVALVFGAAFGLFIAFCDFVWFK